MELSKETYAGSPEKKDIKSVVSDIMQDEAIVGKQTKKVSENPPEKKRRGRPPKNPKKTDDEQTTQKEIPVKKPRGRPRKIKDSQTETDPQKQPSQTEIDPQTDPQKQPSQKQPSQKQPSQTETIQKQPSQTDPQTDPQIDIIPFIQNFSSAHPLHKLPNKTIKYIIFLIQLFQDNPQLHTSLPTHTLHTLLHTIYHHTPSTHSTHHTKHFIYSSIHQGHTTDTNT